MATSITLGPSAKFPVGTTVSAYKQSNFGPSSVPPGGNPPLGSADASAVVAADGTVTLTGLATETAYFAYALVSGEHRYVRFLTADAKTTGVSAGSVGRDALKPSARDMWLPTTPAAVAQNYPYGLATSAAVGLLSTGRLGIVGGITLPAGVPVNAITFVSGSTALVTGTNQWFALYNPTTRALIRQTADDLATAWAAGAAKTLALSSAYTPAVDERVWVGIMVAAATVPTLAGVAPVNGMAFAPAAFGVSNTGLTTTAPNPCNAPTTFNAFPWCCVS